MARSRTKATRQNSNRKIVGAIKKHLGGTVTLAGVKYAPAKLAKMFQDGIDVADATDTAAKAWHVAVATEQDTTAQLADVQALLRNHVSATYGEASTVFSDFGFTPRTAKTVDAATKAAAVEKRAATRRARHTMGKRQRAEVTASVSSEPTVPTAPPPAAAPAVTTSAPAPAPTAIPSQPNGSPAKPAATA